MKYLLIYPMAFYVFYIFFLATIMFRTRVKAIKTKEVSMRFFKTYVGENPSDRTLVTSRHFDNQFQIPMLFFFACLAHLALEQANYLTLILAWLFIVTRMAHSWIHLGSNYILHRMTAFVLGFFIVLIMWAQLAFSFLTLS